MHCFCKEQLVTNAKKFVRMSFKDIRADDPIFYCDKWLITQASQKFIVLLTSLVVVLINLIICFIFEMLSKLEKHHTLNEETMGMFKKITIMQFINISCIILIINFRVETISGTKLFGIIPIFSGSFSDFSVQWYYNIGATLCLTLTINIFSPHSTKLMWAFLAMFKRLKDRGYHKNLRREVTGPGQPDLHTKLNYQ